MPSSIGFKADIFIAAPLIITPGYQKGIIYHLTKLTFPIHILSLFFFSSHIFLNLKPGTLSNIQHHTVLIIMNRHITGHRSNK